jgi:hypothetical protein
MPRFVVLEHDHPFLHWDLMLECGATLRTWRLMRPPDSGGSIEAERLDDHRVAYLDYEGPVSKGRGCVSRWDHGRYEPVCNDGKRIEVELSGEKLRGRAVLQRDSAISTQWRFQFLI